MREEERKGNERKGRHKNIQNKRKIKKKYIR